ncbi:MAG: CBS domain-containing protein [Candidatus Thermoplasmatota archaeon]|nr:CBS domain-containing protein [Candidatus Thermoplasmatota archaeon]MCL5790634.1 CBS domain-containing protein [Candidatus Thermoplasmatota archaeon]
MKSVEEIMTSSPLAIDEEETVSFAMNRMREKSIAQLPIQSRGKYSGMISYRELLRRKSLHLNSKVRNFAMNPPVLNRKNTIKDAIDLLKDTSLGAVPVLEKDKLVGLVSRTDIIKNISDFDEVEQFQAQDIMNEPFSVDLESGVEEALEKIREHDTDISPVVDKDQKIQGIVRLEDVANYDIVSKEQMGSGDFSQKERMDISVKSLMDAPIFSYEDDNLTTSCDLMVRNHLHSLPVCNKGMRLTGVITIDDIISIISSGEETEGLLINISGLSSGDTDLYETIYSMADKFVPRFSRILNLKGASLNIHVIKYHSDEGRIKYSIRTRLLARKTNLTESSSGWNAGRVMSDIFETYERRVKKESGKE